LICLGEVDCGFVIWHQHEVKGVELDIALAKAICGYKQLVAMARQRRPRRLVIMSCPPPTIRDDHAVGEVALLRSGIKASLKDRTCLTQRFNAALREIAVSVDGIFVDLDNELIDVSTGVVREDVRRSDPRDHHLDHAAYAPVIARALRKVGIF